MAKKPVKYVVVDAFTDTAFKGNPAAVCLLEEEKDDKWLQSVAAEFNISETCYLILLNEVNEPTKQTPDLAFVGSLQLMRFNFFPSLFSKSSFNSVSQLGLIWLGNKLSGLTHLGISPGTNFWVISLLVGL
ncbi:hypothetical protein FXO37_13168 [Capsicum annuum]|nr:hypothetical protein FXO37_13168 [Capsicum annuum]